jgi:hypothetical protein
VNRVEMLEGEREFLLIFQGTGGLALLDGASGAAKWSLPLPRGHRISSYTISKTRAYLHVFGPDPAVYGFLSKKLESRILVADLATGRWVLSVPEGSLEPEPPPAKPAPFDPKSFPPVSGCTCDLGALDAGATGRVQLGMYTHSSRESGGRKQFGVRWAFHQAGDSFALPHYDELRETIAPPKTVEGETPLGLACADDVVVLAFQRTATAWSLAKHDELWTVDLPVSQTEPKTTIGGGATITCMMGRIDRARRRVELPAASGGTIALSLEDGSPIGPSPDAGRPRTTRP